MRRSARSPKSITCISYSIGNVGACRTACPVRNTIMIVIGSATENAGVIM